MWLVVVGACFGAVFGTREALQRVDAEARERARDQCVARVETGELMNGALMDLYDIVADASTDDVGPFLERARREADKLLVELDDCLEAIP